MQTAEERYELHHKLKTYPWSHGPVPLWAVYERETGERVTGWYLHRSMAASMMATLEELAK